MDPDDSTIPLDNTISETVEYQGRAYQQYALSNGTYFAPIDEVIKALTNFQQPTLINSPIQGEIARLELANRVFHRVFDNRLIFPPVASPRNILDLGCGGGDWAVQVSEQYPDASVLGIDISPHMLPEDAPDNLELQIDDLNGRYDVPIPRDMEQAEWSFFGARFTFRSDRYDVVHSQMVAGGIHANRWRSYIRDIFRVLRPGGWCQMVEIYFNAQSDNGTLTRAGEDHALSRWSSHYLQAMHPYKDPRAPLQLASWMRSAGFRDVESRLLTLPMYARDRIIGEENNGNIHELLYSIALYPLTHFKGMPLKDFEELVDDARTEASDPSFKVCVHRPKASSVK
ncbi:hypothetical protein ACRE_055480 [Hapsidospora chrysogenum ATCC 11550]|uniref:Uncharacterized protein n=1 Tax=Hapsidospora chrysogenum (strain ATCC 11550 / CBS 779.69 / DSM 880 / IAM 14645 / JCM 23072 / IMI 49137) TaxID=857340 RepID=A0A086T2Y9_HAPC1|nr:hypothetical protein ACRE_055480 [Hapsidospora chrysogenum ATCC 11550]